MRFVLPFMHWRVPVVLLRGHDRVSGGEVTLLNAGRWQGHDFIKQRLLVQEPVVVRRARVPVWRLQRLLDQWRVEADLTAIGIDRVSARLFLDPHHLAVPRWVNSWMNVPDDLKAFARENHSREGDIRRVRLKGYESHYSRDDKDFDLFYDKFYLPFITQRHGAMASVNPRWRLRVLFKRGMLHWVSLGGRRVGGSLVLVKGRDYHTLVIGVLDGRLDLAREGVLSAMYVNAVTHARERGCTRIQMGGSEPSPQDGVFRYKNKWASGLSIHEGFVSANCVTLLSWNRLAGPMAQFFSHTPLLYHDQGGYSALWAFPHNEPLTAENLQQHYTRLKTTGLRFFHILLPADPPADFTCPAKIRLIPMPAVKPGGPEMLEAYVKVMASKTVHAP